MEEEWLFNQHIVEACVTLLSQPDAMGQGKYTTVSFMNTEEKRVTKH